MNVNKWTNALTNFTKDEIQMVHIYVDMAMYLLVTRAMQMTTVRWHYLPTGMAKMKKQIPGVSILGN